MNSESKRSRPAVRLRASMVILLVAIAGFVCFKYAVRSRLDSQLQEIRLRLESGELTSSRDRLLDLQARHSTNAEVVELLADVELRSGDAAAAIEWLKKVPASPADRAAQARYRAAQLAMQLSQISEAEAFAQEAVRLDPQFVEPRRLLMRIYFVLLQQQNLYAQSEALDQRGELSLQELIMRCTAHRAAWNDAEHVDWLEQNMRADPENCQVRAALARYYGKSDRHVAARRVMEDAPDEAPDAWWTLLTRAEDLIEQGQFRDAFDRIRQLPDVADGESRVWLARGIVWNELGHPSAALLAFENASKLDPYDSTPTYSAGRILQQQGESARANLLLARSQQQKELMQLMARLMEAFNPDYELVEPLEQTLRSTARSFGELGMRREAAIVAKELETRAPDGVDENAKPTEDGAEFLMSASLDDLVAVVPPDVSEHVAGGERETTAANATRRPELRLVDVSQEIGLMFRYDTGSSPYRWLMETLGGGVAAMDFDLDGQVDIYLTQGCKLPVGTDRQADSSRLFRNVEGRAIDVTIPARLLHFGYGQGCAVGDYDNDGFPDLVICNYGEVAVFRNLGDGTFENATKPSGVTTPGWSTSAAFSDVDRDGDLDLYVVRYLEAPFDSLAPCKFKGGYTSCRPFNYDAAQDFFWENQGDGRFANRTSDTGLTASEGKGLAVMIADFAREGRESIFVANDTTANFLFEQDSKSQFHENGLLSGVAVNSNGVSEACMGIASGDVDGDGMFDLFVTNFENETNTFYRTLGGGGFVDATQSAGLAETSRSMLGFGCQLLDIDCDGWLDLFVANGHLHEPPQLAQVFHNQGGGRFKEVSRDAGSYFQRPRMGRSVATLDWNRDQLPDLVATYQVENVSLLLNQSTAGGRLSLQMIGTTSNRDAIGTQIRARVGDRDSYYRVDRGGGYFAANDPQVIVGCGEATKIDHLEVTWPSGKVSSWQDVPTGQVYMIVENTRQLLPRRE